MGETPTDLHWLYKKAPCRVVNGKGNAEIAFLPKFTLVAFWLIELRVRQVYDCNGSRKFPD